MCPPNPDSSAPNSPDGPDGIDQASPAQLWRHMGPLARLVALPIYAYRYSLSPYLGRTCRFQPTCSVYGLEALARHGAFRGLYFTARRVIRCHPFGGSGYDPVPKNDASNAS